MKIRGGIFLPPHFERLTFELETGSQDQLVRFSSNSGELKDSMHPQYQPSLKKIRLAEKKLSKSTIDFVQKCTNFLL